MQILTLASRAWAGPWGRVAAAALVLGSNAVAYTHGLKVARGEHAAQQLRDSHAAAEARTETQRLARTAEAHAEDRRQAIARALRAPKGTLNATLSLPPVTCPATVGDAVIPADVWVRLQTIDRAGAPGPTLPGADE